MISTICLHRLQTWTDRIRPDLAVNAGVTLLPRGDHRHQQMRNLLCRIFVDPTGFCAVSGERQTRGETSKHTAILVPAIPPEDATAAQSILAARDRAESYTSLSAFSSLPDLPGRYSILQYHGAAGPYFFASLNATEWHVRPNRLTKSLDASSAHSQRSHIMELLTFDAALRTTAPRETHQSKRYARYIRHSFEHYPAHSINNPVATAPTMQRAHKYFWTGTSPTSRAA